MTAEAAQAQHGMVQRLLAIVEQREAIGRRFEAAAIVAALCEDRGDDIPGDGPPWPWDAELNDARDRLIDVDLGTMGVHRLSGVECPECNGAGVRVYGKSSPCDCDLCNGSGSVTEYVAMVYGSEARR